MLLLLLLLFDVGNIGASGFNLVRDEVRMVMEFKSTLSTSLRQGVATDTVPRGAITSSSTRRSSALLEPLKYGGGSDLRESGYQIP